MRSLFIIFCSLFTLTVATAQEYIMDNEIATTAVAVDDEMKVLYFTASWCGPCRIMKPGIAKMASDPNAKSTIYKMDIDTNITDEVLNVPGVPTFVFLKNGTVLGQHTGAMSEADLSVLFDKHASMQPSNELLAYQPVPTNLKITAGAHPKLTKKTISKLWHSERNLKALAWSIYSNLTEEKDLMTGVLLVNRALEINETSETLYMKVNFLKKLGAKKEALATARKARELMVANGEFTGDLDKMIQQLRS